MPPIVRVILAVLGILAVAVGVIYLAEPVGSLPSFFPGYKAHGTLHHHTRAYIAIGVGVILMIIAAVSRRSRREYY